MRHKARLAGPVEWAELLELSGSDYALSQTYEFGQALTWAYSGYSYEPRVVEFTDGVTMLWPLVRVRRRVSFLRCYEAMPLSLNGAPLNVGGKLTAEHLSSALKSLRADSIYINTGGFHHLPLADGSGADDLTIAEQSTQILDLSSDFGEVWSRRFSGKVRNQCRLAERKGVAVYTADKVADFETYYSIYVASTERWGYTTPPYPLALFRTLAGLAGRGVELKLARVDGRVIAGVLLLHSRRTTFYWGASMLKEYVEYCPNNALLRTAIEDACQRGMLRFDFGSSGELESVRKYKKGFGAQLVSYQNFVLTAPRHRLVAQARKVLAQVGI